MEKQTGSNSSRQGTSESCDINLGCGPAQASSSGPPSGAAAASGEGTPGNSKFAAFSAQQQQHQTAASPGTSIPGVGATAAGATQTQPPITLNINTTTGGNFSVIVDPSHTVENLRKVIAKKLKVARDRICLLHREKELQEGTLKENSLMDGSKIILIPNVETGLLAQRPENTVMQALESLNDSQVNDFLSGKTPLNLSMRLGDHMMLIQLQLSTVNPLNAAATHGSGTSSRTRSSQRSSRSSSAAAATANHNHHGHHYHHHHHHATSSTSTPTTPLTSATSSTAAQRKPEIDLSNSNSGTQSGNQHRSHRMTSASTTPNLRLPAAQAANTATLRSSDLTSFLSKQDYESLQNIVRSIALSQPGKMAQPTMTTTASANPESSKNLAAATNTGCTKSSESVTMTAKSSTSSFQAAESTLLEQSPIKSLSNLVSSPIKTMPIKNIPIASGGENVSCSASVANGASTSAAAAATCQDPISAKLTSCLCTRLNGNGNDSISSGSLKNCVDSSCQSRQESADAAITETHAAVLTSTPNGNSSSTPISATPSVSSSALLHKTANNPIVRSKHRHYHHHHHHHHHYHHNGSNGSGSGSVLRRLPISQRSTSALTNDSGFVSENDISSGTSNVSPKINADPTTPSAVTTAVDLDDSMGVTLTDTRTLAEASRNLTQTLRKLSKEVFTNKIDLTGEEAPRKSSSGAVIESMKNHGKGIYSGTFSGTLNPALQDRYGRPKRDISTVIHILNDLLSATPQYSRGARISFEAPSTSSNSTTGNVGRNNKHAAKHHHNSYSYSADSCPKCRKSQNHSASASSSNASAACPYSECNAAASTSCKQSKGAASYSCCQDVSTASAVTSTHRHHHHHQTADASNANDRNVCSCRYRVHSETGQREREHMCQKCLVEMENNKTKSKLDNLRLVMQQRKQKREARKLKGAPYGARVVGATAEVAAADAGAALTAACAGTGNNSPAAAQLTAPMATASPTEVSPNHIVEEVDTAA